MAQTTYNINERTSYKLTFNFVDENESPISLSDLDTVVLTNYYFNPDIGNEDRWHLATINGRYQQNVKNANNVTITSSGACTWFIQPLDTQKLNTSQDQELHIALFTWNWSSKQNSQEFRMYTRKVYYVPT